jgi:hypothetical protein
VTVEVAPAGYGDFGALVVLGREGRLAQKTVPFITGIDPAL